MKLSNLKNIRPRRIRLGRKKIAILGLGIENYALLEFLLAKKINPVKNKIFNGVNCEITICDIRSKKELGDRYKKIVETHRGASIKWNLGKNYDKNLENYDIIFRVAGYPLTPLAPLLKGGVVISSPTKLFFEICPTKNIIGVTGTNGKGTTSALIAAIFKAAGKRVFCGGNIGVAMFSFFSPAPFGQSKFNNFKSQQNKKNKLPERCGVKKNDWVVLELSSFQLEDLRQSPRIAVITNLTKDHLAPANPANPNFHKSMMDYLKAKTNIFAWQEKNDFAVVNKKLNLKNWQFGRAKKIFYSKSNLASRLVGEHNKENIAAAVEAAKIAGIKNNIIAKAVKNFKGLEYRTEFIKKINGVEYYNDSYSVSPDSAITALKSFEKPIVLIAGGADKGADFKSLAKVIKRKTKLVILLNHLGKPKQATPNLRREILKAGFIGKNIKSVYNMKEAVRFASEQAVAGDIILLSPACASFGMFKNYKERGRLFSEEVEKIK
jgi:UDP-N-acetylmuramoylalanine--D-glutamate ligase